MYFVSFSCAVAMTTVYKKRVLCDKPLFNGIEPTPLRNIIHSNKAVLSKWEKSPTKQSEGVRFC